MNNNTTARLAYLLMLSPSDSTVAISKLLSFIWHGDNQYVIHVDEKAPNFQK